MQECILSLIEIEEGKKQAILDLISGVQEEVKEEKQEVINSLQENDSLEDSKESNLPEQQTLEANKQLIQNKIDANQQRIDELTDLITNHDATIQATIDREKTKGKNVSQQQINDYKKSLESVKATRERNKEQLIAQNQKLTQALRDSKLLEKSEADVQRHVASVEVSKDSDKSSEDWVSQSNEGLDVVTVGKNPKNDKKALKWMIQGKEGFTLLNDPDLSDAEKKEKLKAEKKNLDKLYDSTKKIDLPTVVKWLDEQTWTTKEELQNKVKSTYTGKHPGKVSDFAEFYVDLHKQGAGATLTNQLMQQLVQGARTGMNAVKIFNTKREVNLVNKALDEQLEKAQKQEQKSQERFTPSEKALIGMLADLNADGIVNGVGGEKQKKNNRIDSGNVMGTQILSAYQSAKMQLGAEKGEDTEEVNKILIQNIFSLLLTQKEKIYKDDLSFNTWLRINQFSLDKNGNINLPNNIKTFGDVIDFFDKQTNLLDIVKSSLNASSEYLTQAFIHGAKYAEDHLQREKDVFEETKPAEAGRVNHAIADYQQYAEQHESKIEVNRDIEKKIAPEYEKYLQGLIVNLENQKNDLKKQIDKEKDPNKRYELDEQLKALEQPEFKKSLEDLQNPTKQAEQVKKMRVDFVGALFQHYAFNDGTKSNS
ncbi:hypothetical protein FACS1894176_00720 [Bacteroidia bacterium]|nr:hypothetical protein FACS1894176_00720 [Bacteroidia bacterium]